MSLLDFRLSVEEVALALNLIGQPEMAYSLMAAQVGPMNSEKAQARLMTAGHTLMARGWLTLDAQGELYLSDSLARIAHVLAHADFTLRYSRSYRNADLTLSYHFSKGAIFEHRLEQGVTHHIREIANKDTVIREGLSFFEIEQTSPFDFPPTQLSAHLLDEIKEEKDLSGVSSLLEKDIYDGKARSMLAQDLHNSQYRGSILRVEYDKDNMPRSDEGLLVLRGSERLWLMRTFSQKASAFVTLLPGTEQVLYQEINVLLE